ncbi:MAG: carbamoyltransferase HypF [Candidatus Hydrogenedentes bacterium]|nr:carbamoyltransferase HypF [Candidatus Hydrogenedentota bacterium]
MKTREAVPKRIEPAGYNRARAVVTIHGAVQGIGFRPFIYRLAIEMGISGSVSNTPQGVLIDAEATPELLERFVRRVQQERPPLSSIQHLEVVRDEVADYQTFQIRHSTDRGVKTVQVMPDIATCQECVRELFDPANRRYRYPFMNCTHCGPRFSIIESIPYDRPNTSMKQFEMCDACLAEYEDPTDRRFHAQPNACPKCGPNVEWWDTDGKLLASHNDAIGAATDAVRQGKIVALKGLGGFHLLVDARNDGAVRRLRERKQREEKPLALMFPHVAEIREACVLTELEERLLTSPEAPIVLLRSRGTNVAHSVAPGNPYLGAMLPYTPLHHLLMREIGFPVVATSGNLSDEPICTDEHEALTRLHGIADGFLVHNRPIVRHMDDSVVRVVAGRELVLRRARGYAPLPVQLGETAEPILAVGAHLKNTIAITAGRNAFISQHIGDLETVQAHGAFEHAGRSLRQLYEAHPECVACDMHPDYLSTEFARRLGVEVLEVQHHFAHVGACMAEHGLSGPVLGVSWDGAGYGPDGTVWGGEFLRATLTDFQRVAHFLDFPLPGGDKAARAPFRSALGLLYELYGDELFQLKNLAPVAALIPRERAVFSRMLLLGVNTPRCSSAGRIFDAVAALVGLRQRAAFEGQAAMELEFACDGVACEESYPVALGGKSQPFHLDWRRMLVGILHDLTDGIGVPQISAKFHNTLVDAILEVARRVGEPRVVLSGGCFQNRRLTERAVQRLKLAGFIPYYHHRVPPNDGGIALGQAAIAAARLNSRAKVSVLCA